MSDELRNAINAELAIVGLRLASCDEAGWYFSIAIDGYLLRNIWVTDLA